APAVRWRSDAWWATACSSSASTVCGSPITRALSAPPPADLSHPPRGSESHPPRGTVHSNEGRKRAGSGPIPAAPIVPPPSRSPAVIQKIKTRLASDEGFTLIELLV